MDLEQIERVLEIVAKSGMAEVEVEDEDLRVFVRAHAENPTPVVASQPAPVPAPVAPPPSGDAAPDAASAEGAVASATAAGDTVKAPIVGTFYRAPNPDADSFVSVGDTVAVGDVLCIIEAMKLMNEINCEVAGVVREILVENAEPVEFDQPLFVIEPS